MIDIHNHILPDWDDGPSLMEQSLLMAHQAVAVGTTVMVATPHRFTGGRESRSRIVESRLEELRIALRTAMIPLNIVRGVEIPIDFGIAAALTSGFLTPLGSGNHVLIEPPFPNLPPSLLPAIKELLDSGYQAVLAHPERNAGVQKAWYQEKDLSFVSACADLGCVLQLTSGSILGKFGSYATSVCREISAHRDWKIVIASDSHDAIDRTPGLLGLARDTVASWIDDPEAADVMVNRLPAELLSL
jgi:protein-tyrosine phosphatase